MNVLLALGLLVILGLFGGFLVRRFRFPAITGYLLIGIFLGPSGFNLLSSESAEELSHVVTPLALGIIAYLIGGSLPLSTLKGLKGEIAFITTAQVLCPWGFVLLLVAFVAPWVLPGSTLDFESYLAMGIVIGAISLATAPAATLAIVEESRAKGPLTATLLTVVALDDGLAIMAYAIAVDVVGILLGVSETLAPGLVVLAELGRIALSLLLGVIGAFPLLWLTRFARDRRRRLALVLGTVILSAGFAEFLTLFAVITNMALGFVVINRARAAEDLVGLVQEMEEIIFVLFFTLAGTRLDLGIITSAGMLAVLIVLGRSGGKFVGAWIGAAISGAPRVVRKYLGFALMPKAGITVGLALLVLQRPEFQAFSNLLVSAVLASTLINELITPPLSKFALARAGETGRAEGSPVD